MSNESNDSEKNGNGTGKVVWWLMGMLASLIVAGILGWTARASSAQDRALALAQEAKDKAIAVDAKLDGQNALIRYRLDEIEKRQREDSETLGKIWDRLQERRR